MWVKVDDSFHSHPKVIATGDLAAIGLWALAATWCGDNQTQGFVPDHVVAHLYPGAGEHVGPLVSAGLWLRRRGGYQFHDWSDYQPSPEAVSRRRQQWRDSQARRRQRLTNVDTLLTRQHGLTKVNGSARPERDDTFPADSEYITSVSAIPSTVDTPDESSVESTLIQRGVNAPRPDPYYRGDLGGGTYVSRGPDEKSPQDQKSGEERPPSPRCAAHADAPADGPCGPCGDARRVRAAWDADTTGARAQAVSDHARRRAVERGRAIAQCPHCDTSGYVGVQVCDHVDRSETNRRGIAAARQALKSSQTAATPSRDG